MVTTIAVALTVLATLAIVFRPAFRRSETWRATVTPLASITGSGFLVVALLLTDDAGRLAPLSMAALVLIGYVMGAVMRFNILHLEPQLEKRASATLRTSEYASHLALVFAYVISVSFYL